MLNWIQHPVWDNGWILKRVQDDGENSRFWNKFPPEVGRGRMTGEGQDDGGGGWRGGQLVNCCLIVYIEDSDW